MLLPTPATPTNKLRVNNLNLVGRVDVDFSHPYSPMRRLTEEERDHIKSYLDFLRNVVPPHHLMDGLYITYGTMAVPGSSHGSVSAHLCAMQGHYTFLAFVLGIRDMVLYIDAPIHRNVDLQAPNSLNIIWDYIKCFYKADYDYGCHPVCYSALEML